MGNRLKPFTSNIPKCMVKLGGKSLLEWQIDALKSCDINDITIVTGYRSDSINLPNITYFKNPNFQETNMSETLFCAKTKLDDSVIISYSDIVYEKKIIQLMLNFKGDLGVVVDLGWKKSYIGRTDHPYSEAENVLIENNKVITIKKNINKSSKNQIIAEFLGLVKLSKNGCQILLKKYDELSKSHKGKFHTAPSFKKAYLTDMLQELIDSGYDIEPLFFEGKWCEIDTPQDLERAKKFFC